MDLEELRASHQDRFFRWVRECAKLLGIVGTEKEPLLVEDRSWFFCFDDGMTPEQAVAEYRSKHPIVVTPDVPPPSHGTERDRHYAYADGTRAQVFDPATTHLTSEKWCATCKAWVRVEGVVGALKFMIQHDAHAVGRGRR